MKWSPGRVKYAQSVPLSQIWGREDVPDRPRLEIGQSKIRNNYSTNNRRTWCNRDKQIQNN